MSKNKKDSPVRPKGFFDFNRDGKLSGMERAMQTVYLMSLLEEKEQHHWVSGGEDDSWRLYAEDGWEYGLDPDDYETEEEYEEALEEARYAWRDLAADGSDYDLNPEDFETEEEYEDALDEAKGQWRFEVEDGWEYDLDSFDFDTREEYEEALREAKRIRGEESEEYTDHDPASGDSDGFVLSAADRRENLPTSLDNGPHLSNIAPSIPNNAPPPSNNAPLSINNAPAPFKEETRSEESQYEEYFFTEPEEDEEYYSTEQEKEEEYHSAQPEEKEADSAVHRNVSDHAGSEAKADAGGRAKSANGATDSSERRDKDQNDNEAKKNNKKRVLFFLILILATAAVLTATAGYYYNRHVRFSEEKAAFDRMAAVFDEEFPAYLEKQYDDFPLAERTEAAVSTTVRGNGADADNYYWYEDINVTVFVSDEFDTLSKEKICSNLKDVERILNQSKEKLRI